MAKRSARDDVLRFPKWFLRNRFNLMEAHLDGLRQPLGAASPDLLERRFLQATAHGKRVVALRFAILVLISLSGVSSLLSAAFGAFTPVPAVQATLHLLTVVGGVLFGLSGVIFLAINRYLDRVTTTATFLGMQLAAASSPGDAADATAPAPASTGE